MCRKESTGTHSLTSVYVNSMLMQINQRLYLLSQLKLQGLNIQAVYTLFRGLPVLSCPRFYTHCLLMQANLPLTIDTGWVPCHERLYDAASHTWTLTLKKSSIASTANCFPRLPNLDIVYTSSPICQDSTTALVVFAKDGIPASYLKLNIHSIKTLSSVIVCFKFR